MQEPAFTPGLRFSILDGIVLIISAIATIALSMMTWQWGFIVGYVVVHFYLFCNVFRISRPLELIWAGIFVCLAGFTIVTESPGWAMAIAVSLVTTLIVIAIEMKKPSYHGVAWQKINPTLQSWWKARHNLPE